MSVNNSARVVRAPSVVSQDIKEVMLGESNVGKTCICARFVQGRFPTDTTMTIGATYSTKIINVQGRGGGGGGGDMGRRAKLQIWDTAGQERFRSMARLYFREAKIGIVCFDIMDKNSLSGAEYWINELRRHAGEDILIALAANKIDLADGAEGGVSGGGGRRAISHDEASRLAQEYGVRLFNTSAVTGEGIVGAGNIFESMVEELLQNSIQNEGAGFDVGFSGRTRLQIPERPQFTHDPTEGRSWQCC